MITYNSKVTDFAIHCQKEVYSLLFWHRFFMCLVCSQTRHRLLLLLLSLLLLLLLFNYYYYYYYYYY